MKAKKFLLAALALTLLGCNSSTNTDDGGSDAPEEIKWPEKTIEIICPYSAGGGSDTMARSLGEALTQTGMLGQSVIVTNKTGGNGIIGASYVANLPDDQYTFVTNVTGDLGAWISADSGMSLDYFKPVAMFCWDSYVLVVKTDSPYQTIDDIINASKEKKGSVVIAGTGIGTVDNILYVQMKDNYGLDAEYVAYDGGGDVVTAILGGHVTANWCNPSEAAKYVESGDMRAIAVAGDQRLEKLPDVPCTQELGFDKIMWRQYRGLLAPKNMPDEYIEKLVGIMEVACTSDYFLNEYIDKNMLVADFKSGAEFEQVLTEMWDQLEAVLK